jgi:hypothetical protein
MRRHFQQFGCTGLVWLVWLFPLVASGDTIKLKSGQTITGTWIGATNREVRIAVADRVETISINDIDTVTFGDAAPVGSTGSKQASAVPAKPETSNKQARFCEVIAAYRADLMRIVNEPNAIVRAGLPKPEPAVYDRRLLDLLGTSGEFDSWKGAVNFHVAGQWVVLQFTPDCKPPQAIEFSTANTLQAGVSAQTLIPLNSPIARTLSHMKESDSVIASGHLFYLGTKIAYRGSADNPNPSVAAPRYLAQFTTLARIEK